MFEVQQNFLKGFECLILNADIQSSDESEQKFRANPIQTKMALVQADQRNLMRLQNGFAYFVLHRAHSRVKSRGQGGCDML